jgi:hypothetical protein
MPTARIRLDFIGTPPSFESVRANACLLFVGFAARLQHTPDRAVPH